MKQTIWTASLEESINLVTDKYIETSLADINEKGYKRKILGFFTILFFQFLMERVSVYMDSQGVRFLFIPATWVFRSLFLLGFIPVILYLIDVSKIKHVRILSYYFYNKNAFYMASIFSLQVILFCIVASGIVGGWLAYVVYGLIYTVIIMERIQWFRKSTYRSLYQQEEFRNPFFHLIENLVSFSKKYGGLILLPLALFRLFFPVQESAQENSFVRTAVLLFSPLMAVILVYFFIAIAVENFQGYYVKKYLEEYRQISGHSLEEWYGKKSKMYKESLKHEPKE